MTMSQKLPVNGFKWKKSIHKFYEEFMKNYHEDSNEGYILEVDVEYPKNVLNLHGDLPFLAERKKIKKCNKLFCSINDKENYVVHISALKQSLNQVQNIKLLKKVTKINYIKITLVTLNQLTKKST